MTQKERNEFSKELQSVYGEDSFFYALYALSDMVVQFGYPTTFRNQKAVCDGGLSALESAFWALQICGCKTNSNGTISLKNLFEFQRIAKEQAEKSKE